ncbi:unnamed protein product [Acanthosepion pharaonis]|uniref:Uncharacterized protein n=1 Tax=Acanthosepion pharaonis TaxID=158019 RepID=A0A812BW69_ACAPH|nr:unnamed protein product [Sepia pharaonis]
MFSLLFSESISFLACFNLLFFCLSYSFSFLSYSQSSSLSHSLTCFKFFFFLIFRLCLTVDLSLFLTCFDVLYYPQNSSLSCLISLSLSLVLFFPFLITSYSQCSKLYNSFISLLSLLILNISLITLFIFLSLCPKSYLCSYFICLFLLSISLSLS